MTSALVGWSLGLVCATTASAAVPTDFAKGLEITSAVPTGGATLTNFPVLVRLGTSISGFSYDDFQLEGGGDLMFTDDNGTPLAHEVDTWNANGTSLVWVKVPELTQGSKIHAYYGNGVDPGATASDAWNGYAGVWHLGEDNGTAYDATANNLNGTPSGSKAASMVSYANGAVGKARVNFADKSYLSIPNYNTLGLGGTFTISGWFLANSVSGYPRLFSRKREYAANDGWEIEMSSSSKVKASARGAGGTSVTVNMPDITANWLHLALVYNGTTLSCYTNGALSASGMIGAATDNGYPLSFGCDSDGSESAFNGQYDEIRLVDGVATPIWVAAEYAVAANPGALSYGVAADLDETAPKFATPTIVKNGDGTFSVSVSLTDGEGDLYVLYNDSVTNALSNGYVQAPQSYTDTPSNLATNTCYAYAAFGTNANGTAVTKSGAGAFLTGEVSVEKTADADEYGLVAGSFIFSRPANDEARLHDLAVAYTVSGTAIAGQNYVDDLSGTLVIPAGEASASLVVTPLIDASVSEDTTLVLTISDGLYFLGTASATMTVKNLAAPAGYNTWVAAAAGKASTVQNWSEGRVPNSADNILLDGRFSTAAMEWDAGVNGLPDTVASWTQTADYTGTVTFPINYTNVVDAVFTNFTVAGNAQILGGSWTHPQSIYQTSGSAYSLETMRANARYRLRVSVGGDMTIGSAATINATEKGYWRYMTGSNLYGSHGGLGNGATIQPYGDPKCPTDIGYTHSPGTDSLGKTSSGGGAVYLTVGGTLTVNGTIAADGSKNSIGGSAAGSIYLQADAVAGSGSVHANGVKPASDKEAGAGGRVAVVSTTTIADTLALAATSGGAYYSGCGTVYTKDQNGTHGTLRVANTLSTQTGYNARTPVTDEGDWTFDAVVVGSCGRVSVGADRTLTLPNGLASVSSSDASSPYDGILVNGGAIAAGTGDQTMTGGWTLQINQPYTFPGNLSLESGARLGIFRMLMSGTNNTLKADYTVDGNLTVDANSSVDVSQIYHSTGVNAVYPPATHGGWSVYNNYSNTYGSVFHPATLGSSQSKGFYGSGILKLTVGGALTVNGTIGASGAVSDSTYDGTSAASGGSLDITAGSLSGSGSIDASGAAGRWNYAGGGAGGRIAVRLTGENADFADAPAINAQGQYGYAFNVGASKFASAGTVYTQTADQGEKGGTILVSNFDKAFSDFTTFIASGKAFPTTPIVARGIGKDEATDFNDASLIVTKTAIAEVSAPTLKMKSLNVANGSRLELAGNTLMVNAAVIGETKLPTGTYTASSAEVTGYVVDSVGGGSVVVLGAGTVVVVR